MSKDTVYLQKMSEKERINKCRLRKQKDKGKFVRSRNKLRNEKRKKRNTQ